MPTVSLKSSAGKWVMVSTILASAMAFIDGTALNVVLPSLQKSLHATGADVFWILNAYLLMLASLLLIGGSLGDRLGRKKVFMTGIAVFIAGSAACGFSPNVPLLVAFRMLQGIGGALMIPGSLSLISSTINEDERGKAIGTWSAVTTAVTVGGPILGGALADAGLWRYIFFINVPIGVAALIFLTAKVKETKDDDNDKMPDVAGAVTIALGLAALTFGFLRIPATGMENPQVYGSLTAGILLLAAFIFIEQKSSHPMMPLKLFAGAAFSGANLLSFFLYAGLGAGMLFLSLNLVQVQGYTQLQSGLTFLPFTVLMISVTRFAGAMADKRGPRLFLIAGPAIAGAGLLWLSFVGQTSGPAAYWQSFFPGIIVFGAGMAVTVAPLTATVMSSVSDHFSGVASGVNNAVTRIANVFANAIFGALAVLLFAAAVKDHVKATAINQAQKTAVIAQSANLGNAAVPATIGAREKAQIVQVYHTAFISVYSVILKISALLAFLSAVIAFVMIRNTKKNEEHPVS